jgi:hypothetical protein
MRFPLPYVPTQSYRGGRGFGASREKVRKGLRHGAVDLMAPPGTPVLAIDDGVVIGGPSPFFRGTYALEVKHPSFVARYSEIARNTEVRVGSLVKAGQVIAYVGDQPGHDMLHLEMFAGTLDGALTQKGKPFDRREMNRLVQDTWEAMEEEKHGVTWTDGPIGSRKCELRR